jgi:hypothetical protein
MQQLTPWLLAAKKQKQRKITKFFRPTPIPNPPNILLPLVLTSNTALVMVRVELQVKGMINVKFVT